MNIWELWHREAAVVFRDGDPLWNVGVTVYLIPEPNLSDIRVQEKVKKTLGDIGDITVQRDFFVNVLFYAVMHAQADVIIFGLEKEAVFIGFEALQGIATAINQLSTILALKAKLISPEQFAREMKDEIVYFSTPLGEDSEGRERLYLLSATGSDIPYFPVFLTREHMHDFFKRENRSGYLVLENTLHDFLSTLSTNEKFRQLGVVIEPFLSCNVALPPMLRID